MFSKKSFFINLLQSFFEYLLLFPLYLMFAIYNISSDLLWIWLVTIPSLYFLGVLYRTIFYKQSWLMNGLIAIAIGVFVGQFFSDHIVIKIILMISHPVFMFRGMMYTTRSRQSLLSTAFLWIGGPVNYFICFFFYYYLERLQPFLLIFTLAGILTISIILFLANNDHLRTATLSKDATPFISRNIKRQNHLFLILTIILIFLASSTAFLRKVFWKIVDIIRGIIQWALYAGSTVKHEERIGQPAPERPSMPLVMEGDGPSQIAVFLGVIILYATYVFIAIVLIMIILLLIKRTRQSILRLIKIIAEFLKNLANRLLNKGDEYTQYVDEKENIFDFQEWRKEQQDRLKGLFENVFERKPSWDSLSNEEKVRFIYRYLLNKNIDKNYVPHLTPREILTRMTSSISITGENELLLDKLGKAYEQTRYGDEEVDEETILEIYTLIKEK